MIVEQFNAPQDFWAVNTFDTLDRVTQFDRYSHLVGGNLISRSQTLYDDRGRVYQTIVYGVNPFVRSGQNGLGPGLTSNTWYDAAGNVIKQLPAGSNAFTKMVYDALGRQTAQYIGYDLGSSESSYASASDITDDTIMEQVETAYDAAGNVIQTTTRQRFHNATGTGGLSQPGGAQPQARVTYVAVYPDAIGRQQAVADYGANGDGTLSRSATVPTSGASVLVSTLQYASDGTVAASFDAAGTQTQFFFDQAGRKTTVVENVAGATSSSSAGGGLPASDDANPHDRVDLHRRRPSGHRHGRQRRNRQPNYHL